MKYYQLSRANEIRSELIRRTKELRDLRAIEGSYGASFEMGPRMMRNPFLSLLFVKKRRFGLTTKGGTNEENFDAGLFDLIRSHTITAIENRIQDLQKEFDLL